MKISKRKLKQLIKEELQRALKEQEGEPPVPPMPDPKILLKLMCANKKIVISSLEKSSNVENLKKILLNSIPGLGSMIGPFIKMIEEKTGMNIDQVLKIMRSTGPLASMAKLGITMSINALCSAG